MNLYTRGNLVKGTSMLRYLTPLIVAGVLCFGSVALAETDAPQPNANVPRTLSDAERQFMAEEIARHDHSLFSEDHYEAVTKALLLKQGIPATKANIELFVSHLRETNPVNVSLPEKSTPQVKAAIERARRVQSLKNAQQAVSPRNLTPLQRFPFEAGAATVTLRMPIGVPVPGFGRFPPDLNVILDPYDYAKIYTGNKGMHDELYVKVVFIRHNGDLYCIVGVDAVGAIWQIRDAIIPVLNNRGIPISKDRFIFTATHNHSGPGAASDTPMWQVTTADVYDQRVFDIFIERLANASEEAYNNLEPATIGYGQYVDDQLPLQKNRRDDPTKIDREIGVIRFNRVSDGSALAVIFNVACHPSCLGTSNLYYTGDFCGYAERKIEKDLGGNCVAFFVNSAQGDIDPTIRGFDGARILGEDLADRVVAFSNTLQYSDTMGLSISTEEKTFPPPFVRPGFFDDTVPLWFTISLVGILEDFADFTALRINDDAVLATVPGEAITDIGWEIKAGMRQLGYQNAFVFGLSQNMLAYFTTEEEYWQGEYEAGASLFGPNNGNIVTGFALDVVDNVSR